MMLAALSAMSAAGVMTVSGLLTPPGRTADLLKAGAAVQFMHSMATLACATVMQIGGAQARRAPPFFLTSVPLLSGSIYALAFGAPPQAWLFTACGALAAAVGWAILALATLSVDDGPRAVRNSPQPRVRTRAGA
jgi:uncharacterized membrane protein YgdD (TMEM256/DUF423 family)